MGKQVLESIEDRIINASGKAETDGYERGQVCWYVTRESLNHFRRCWAYMEALGMTNIYPKRGRIDGIWVVMDEKLKGNIAELRPIEGSDYAITLDFAEQTD